LTTSSMNPSVMDEIYQTTGVIYFENDLRPLLEIVIEKLYHSHKELVLRLRLCHIDRALFKFRQAKEKTFIRNTKQYFKSCIKSAALETAFDNLDAIDSMTE
jgi:hypothetical protein